MFPFQIEYQRGYKRMAEAFSIKCVFTAKTVGQVEDVIVLAEPIAANFSAAKASSEPIASRRFTG